MLGGQFHLSVNNLIYIIKEEKFNNVNNIIIIIRLKRICFLKMQCMQIIRILESIKLMGVK